MKISIERSFYNQGSWRRAPAYEIDLLEYLATSLHDTPEANIGQLQRCFAILASMVIDSDPEKLLQIVDLVGKQGDDFLITTDGKEEPIYT